MAETVSVSTSLYLDMNDSLPDVSEYEKEYKKALKNKESDGILESLREKIETGHDYKFVGKVGQFTPVRDICHGGLLMRKSDTGYAFATGTKGHRWLETEYVKDMCNLYSVQDIVDISYYRKLVDDAKDVISKYGDFEEFANYSPPNMQERS